MSDIQIGKTPKGYALTVEGRFIGYFGTILKAIRASEKESASHD